ncbi:unnamed protein product [Lymnaea stagnalis]|uniref:WAP domain-containing protein n=1 Tax=Lymnaea stagnalis TaxID=6523 RepID=A0AAV2I1D8_LYMST
MCLPNLLVFQGVSRNRVQDMRLSNSCTKPCPVGLWCVEVTPVCGFGHCPIFHSCLSYDYLRWYNVDGYTRVREIVTIEARPGCPRVTNPSRCDRPCLNDSGCPSEWLCCSIRCGRACKRDRTARSSMKYGSCPPPPTSRHSILCSDGCTHDRDCRGLRKCCQTSCGVTCVDPCSLVLVNSQWEVPERCREG